MNTEIFYKNPLLIIYVPGYLSGDSSQREVKQQLYRLYNIDINNPRSPDVVIFNWDSVASYARALHNSIQAADDLVQYLKELPCGNRIVIIGHSLGALVVAKAMQKVPFNSYYGAKQVIFLGAAVDSDTKIKHICKLTEYPVINVINKNDVILNTLYRTFSEVPALGSRGLICKRPDNYVELEILPRLPQYKESKTISDVANQLLDVTGHSSSRVYLDSLIRGNYRCR